MPEVIISGFPHYLWSAGLITVALQIYIVSESEQDGRFCIYQIFLIVARHQAFYVILSSMVFLVKISQHI